MMMVESDLLVVGAGAKSAAIATKVHALNNLGLGPIALTIVESTEPAASWSGRNGLTSGREPLAVTPVKDVGFPYQSYRAFGEDGDAIDSVMLGFSWHHFLISKRKYARWIDAGLPAVQHREYGQYIASLLSRATEGVNLVRGRVTQVSLQAGGGRWVVDVTTPSGPAQYRCPAFVLTGPGIHRPISHEPDVAARIFHCDSRRVELARIPREGGCEIAIVGGGESALSALALLRGSRPDAIFTVYTPNLPMSRAESFLENRVFSNPDDVAWSAQSLESRRDFVRHSDRGVFDPQTLSDIAYDDRCRFVTGRVMHVAAAAAGGKEKVRVNCSSAAGPFTGEHDYLVNCTGFDLLEQLRALLPVDVQTEVDRRVGQLWQRPPEAEIPIGRNLELKGMYPRLHVPGLAGLSQGPGFANLGSLGILANRVLEPLVLDRRRVDGAGAAGSDTPISMPVAAGALRQATDEAPERVFSE
jgi:mycobactin lysine-N-oxygenase